MLGSTSNIVCFWLVPRGVVTHGVFLFKIIWINCNIFK
jgi:hypothetical protein